MTGILRFRLPEEQGEFLQAQKAGQYLCALWEMSEWLRRQLKNELHPDMKDARSALEMVQNILNGELVSRGIDYEEQLR